MKKTLSINIAGIIFHIEEDAFATLDAYIKSIHAYFESFEGSKEIIADIEARIAEKFWGIREDEKTEAISLEQVNALIASLGTVADFQALESEEDKKENSELAAMLLPELRKVAAQLGIDGASTMKKPALVTAIADLQAANREAAKAEREARRAERDARRKGGNKNSNNSNTCDGKIFLF